MTDARTASETAEPAAADRAMERYADGDERAFREVVGALGARLQPWMTLRRKPRSAPRRRVRWPRVRPSAPWIARSWRCRLRDARAFVLLRFEGLSVADAAEVLGVSDNAVKLRAFQAYELIREALRRLEPSRR